MVKYNGWKNYQTWSYSIWIDNDQSLANRIQEALKNNNSVTDLADVLESFMEESKPELEGIYADLLQASVDEIDYREIAEAILKQ